MADDKEEHPPHDGLRFDLAGSNEDADLDALLDASDYPPTLRETIRRKLKEGGERVSAEVFQRAVDQAVRRPPG